MIRQLFVASALVLAVAYSAPAFAEDLSPECKAMWEKADVKREGYIAGAEAKRYLDAMEKAGMKAASADGKLNAAEFYAACEKDAFINMAE